jgi:hypothetical protein
MAAGAGYIAWHWWSPGEEEAGQPSTIGASHAADQQTVQSSGSAAATGSQQQQAQGSTMSGAGPVQAPPPDPGVKAIVRRMFEEWKRRHLSTERKAHGAMLYDLSELLTDLKKRALYTEQAIFREIERSLRALGVPPDQSAEVAASIIEQATLDGKKAEKKQSSPFR